MTKIVPIFVHDNEPKGLYCIQYEGYPYHEFERFVREFTNPQVVRRLVVAEKTRLARPPIKLKPSQAEVQIYTEADKLIALLTNKENLGLAQFLAGLAPYLENLSPNQPDDNRKKVKASGSGKHPLIRIYAFEPHPQLWIITGYGIKLTKTMQEDPVIDDQRIRLNIVRAFFKKNTNVKFDNSTLDLAQLTF